MLAHGGRALIVNVTSGGAYIPQVFAPVYSACKAALHSYTVTLRHALAGTNCRVVELVPPAVRTALAGPATHGADLAEFCDTVYPQLLRMEVNEVGFGPTKDIQRYSAAELMAMFAAAAARNPVPTYARDAE